MHMQYTLIYHTNILIQQTAYQLMLTLCHHSGIPGKNPEINELVTYTDMKKMFDECTSESDDKKLHMKALI